MGVLFSFLFVGGIIGSIVFIIVQLTKGSDYRGGSSESYNMRSQKYRTQNGMQQNFPPQNIPQQHSAPQKQENVCPACGGKNALNDRFCGFCGSVLDVQQSTQPAQNYNQNYNSYPANTAYNSVPQHRVNYNSNSRPLMRSQTKKAVLIIISIFAAFFIAFIAFVSFLVYSFNSHYVYDDYYDDYYTDQTYCDVYSNDDKNYQIYFEGFNTGYDFEISENSFYDYNNYYYSTNLCTVKIDLSQNHGNYLLFKSGIDSGYAKSVIYSPDCNNVYSNSWGKRYYQNGFETVLSDYQYYSYDLSKYQGDYLIIDFYFYNADGNISISLSPYSYSSVYSLGDLHTQSCNH